MNNIITKVLGEALELLNNRELEALKETIKMYSTTFNAVNLITSKPYELFKNQDENGLYYTYSAISKIYTYIVSSNADIIEELFMMLNIYFDSVYILIGDSVREVVVDEEIEKFLSESKTFPNRDVLGAYMFFIALVVNNKFTKTILNK